MTVYDGTLWNCWINATFDWQFYNFFLKASVQMLLAKKEIMGKVFVSYF